MTEFQSVLMGNATARRILDSGGSIEDVVVALNRRITDLVNEVVTLRNIAPKKIVAPDGKVLIWRCPEELIPEV